MTNKSRAPAQFSSGASPPLQNILSAIIVIREKSVMLDRDLALLYGVETKRLNEQVKRNITRFPVDFMFQITQAEKDKVVANCDHLQSLKYSVSLPYAFTEHGAVMLASILKSQEAIQASIQVVRAFVELRNVVYSHRELSKKINELELKYDYQFSTVFKALRELIDTPKPARRQIGFRK